MLKLTETKSILLELENGKSYEQKKVPAFKYFDYAKIETELFERSIEKNQPVSPIDLKSVRLKFLAELFDNEEVTESLLLENLDCADLAITDEIITYRVMLNQKSEENDGESKK